MDLDRFLELARALWAEGVDYVLVGGVAVNLHGILRATEDVDLFVRLDEENVAKLRTALRKVWDDPEIAEIRHDDLVGEYPTIRYGPPGEEFVIDILGRLGTAFRFEDLEAEVVEVEGAPVRLATPRTLYRMKRDTVRPIDKADAVAILEKFQLEDES